MTELTLNGEPVALGPEASVADAVRSLGASEERGVAVAVDGEIVPRARWSDTPLADGAAVEVVRAVQGG